MPDTYEVTCTCPLQAPRSTAVMTGRPSPAILPAHVRESQTEDCAPIVFVRLPTAGGP